MIVFIVGSNYFHAHLIDNTTKHIFYFESSLSVNYNRFFLEHIINIDHF